VRICYKDRSKTRLLLTSCMGDAVFAAEHVILALKVAVVAVTLLLAGSLAALARRRYRLHGRLNLAVFVLTLTALLVLEGIARVLNPGQFEEYFDRTEAWTALYVHLSFSLPAAVVLCVMLYTGLRHRRALHIPLGVCFLVLWTGTLITGVFFLPHTSVP
jgi:ribose/xylose/arabinose/galactoside ABC-type transport system permease subunit